MKGDLSRVAIAKPLYGTTRAHYTMLWQTMGADALSAWHQDCRKRGIKEVRGNAMSRDLVASGICDFGLTDTDDFFGAVDNDNPVAQVPATVQGDKTICIPNTVAIVRGTRRIEKARRLIDYLLSAKVEVALACSASRQVPIGPIGDGEIPEAVNAMRPWVSRSFPIADLGPARTECLKWLKAEYAPALSDPSK
jgi:iron(III) transport system substrate-binding protein